MHSGVYSIQRTYSWRQFSKTQSACNPLPTFGYSSSRIDNSIFSLFSWHQTLSTLNELPSGYSNRIFLNLSQKYPNWPAFYKHNTFYKSLFAGFCVAATFNSRACLSFCYFYCDLIYIQLPACQLPLSDFPMVSCVSPRLSQSLYVSIGPVCLSLTASPRFFRLSLPLTLPLLLFSDNYFLFFPLVTVSHLSVMYDNQGETFLQALFKQNFLQFTAQSHPLPLVQLH